MEHDIQKLETGFKQLHREIGELLETTNTEEFIRIIHAPGWTTPAEALLVSGLIESTIAQVRAVKQAQHVLLAGAKAVGAKQTAAV